MQALRQEVEALRREVSELRQLLLDRRAPETRDVAVGVVGRPVKGAPQARVTLVEFSDYQCPFCARHARETLPQLEREYVDTGKLRYVFRDFPITSLHPRAAKVHEAAHCAGDQGRFWEMHARLFAHQKAIAPDHLPGHAAALGLDGARFEQCLASGRHAEAVRGEVGAARQARVTATPTFLLGLTPADDGPLKVVRVIRGAQPYRVFRDAIEELLAAQR